MGGRKGAVAASRRPRHEQQQKEEEEEEEEEAEWRVARQGEGPSKEGMEVVVSVCWGRRFDRDTGILVYRALR